MAMAGSNSDSEDYCSSEDEDYVPSGEDYSEDDVNELVKEDDPNEDEEDVPKGRGKKRSSKSALVRKRKKGDLLLEPEEGQAETETLTADGRTEETGDLMRKKNVAVTEEEKKKKDDELWASFLSDVGKEPKVAPPVVSSRIQETKPAGKSQESHSRTEEETPEIEDSIDASKVKITKVFDFAGEEISQTCLLASSDVPSKLGLCVSWILMRDVSCSYEPKRTPVQLEFMEKHFGHQNSVPLASASTSWDVRAALMEELLSVSGMLSFPWCQGPIGKIRQCFPIKEGKGSAYLTLASWSSDDGHLRKLKKYLHQSALMCDARSGDGLAAAENTPR
ncbi:craniofacial development protein 1 isoform X1 [Rhinatrema bivittatum]|uniref:craniofacial development protein 1 isoform X1 n=1 Tax=Rhinatrema bivittatum TaxID=194408 RepID=UPI00112B18D5|nr:craniofacial development protein 1 isoform X1 [Rhinatrema bivittatum]